MTSRGMMYSQGLFSARPAASVGNGYVYFATDTGNLYQSNGSAWTLIGTTAGGSVTYGTPAISLGTAAAAGSTDEAIRRDSTIVAFDATAPTTQAFGDSAAAGSAAVAARRDHTHGMPATPSSVSGNAGTATALQTARTINGTSFDGTANITTAMGTLTRSPRSSNTILAAADRGTVICATAAYTQTLTAAATLAAGWWCIIKNDTADGTTVLTLDPNASETIDGLTTATMYSGETRLIECDGANFTSQLLAGGYAKFIPTGGNFIVPTGIAKLDVVCIGSGGQGGGGASAVAGKGGGAGGGGGAVTQASVRPTDLTAGATVTVTVAAGGTGSGTPGSAGANGGTTSFGSLLKAGGGGGGGAGGNGVSANGGGGGSSINSAATTTAGAPSSNPALSGQAATAGGAGVAGVCSEFGGASGGGTGLAAGLAGGSSIFGGPAGGGGGAQASAGGAGGTVASYTAGGGGGGGGGGASPAQGTPGSFIGPYRCAQSDRDSPNETSHYAAGDVLAHDRPGLPREGEAGCSKSCSRKCGEVQDRATFRNEAHTPICVPCEPCPGTSASLSRTHSRSYILATPSIRLR